MLDKMEPNVIKERNKKRVIKCLANGRAKSSTAIAIEIKIHYYYLTYLLVEMGKEGIIEKDKRGKLTFWKLKKETQK